ncbi:MAG: hypothetical protein M3311_00385 [Thermoproteota archaeon]|nr:hypothetical protein [Thermoproteota archaeon]
MMNSNVKLATMFIVVALGTIGTTATAFAQPEGLGEEITEEHGDVIEAIDELVHETSPPEEGEEVSDEDVAFHTALYQADISTEALEELDGCDILPDFTPDLDEDDEEDEDEDD